MTPKQTEWYHGFVDRLDGLLDQYGCSNAVDVDADGNIFIADQDDNFYSDYGDVLLEGHAYLYTNDTEDGQIITLVDFTDENGEYWFTDEIPGFLPE